LGCAWIGVAGMDRHVAVRQSEAGQDAERRGAAGSVGFGKSWWGLDR